MPDQAAFEAALEEAIALFEQGEGLDHKRFDALLAEIETRRNILAAVPEDDPRVDEIRRLQERADELEARVAAGKGSVMDEVNQTLSPLMGRKGA
jgi:cell division septum initiation protein DivIVA